MAHISWENMGSPDEINETYLLVAGDPSIDSEILATLLADEGATVETVRSLTAAAKKLRSKSIACTVILSRDSTLVTHVRSTVAEQPVVVLYEGSATPPPNSALRSENVHAFQHDTANPERAVTNIRDVVTKANVNGHLDRHARLQNAIRRLLSAFHSAGSREELETMTCDRFVSSTLYSAAWVASPDETDNTVVPRVAAGISRRNLAPIPVSECDTSTLQVDGDGESGYTITIPLRRETEFLGSLSLATTREIDAAERDLLGEVGDDLTRAISSAEEPSNEGDSERASYSEHAFRAFSHELRNHLQAARAELRAVRDSDRGDLDRVFAALDRIERVDREASLLTQRTIDTNQLSTHSLSAIVEDVRTRRPQLAEKVAVLESNPILAHRPLTELLLENLFRNSLDHAGLAVEIRVGTIEDGFFVEDTGTGLPDVPPDSLFELGTSIDGNTGTGLAIVKRIVELHEWEITATTSAEGGARFEITGVPVVTKRIFEPDSNAGTVER